MELGLSGKTVLVTGGSRGIGRQIALSFAQEHACVAICARDSEQLQVTAEEIRQLGTECLAISADLAQATECNRVIAETVSAFGGLDSLVNNAGAALAHVPPSLTEASDDELMERVWGKALAAIRCSRAALPFLAASGNGRIVFIAGTSARFVTRGPERRAPVGSRMASGLGNAMISNFAKMLGEQAAKDGILVNVVHPHAVRTERHPTLIRSRATQLGVTEGQAEADLVSYIPIGRITEPGDIAPLVVLLASPANGAITGQAIAVDGGASRSIAY